MNKILAMVAGDFTPHSIVKLAVMRRMADLRIDLSVACQVAEATAERLITRGSIGWDEYIFLRPDDATERAEGLDITIISSSNTSPLIKWGLMSGDPAFMRVSNLVEPDRHFFPRRIEINYADVAAGRCSGDRSEQPIDQSRRASLASHGIHAEPVIVFPLGEIVNGALTQLPIGSEVANSV